MREIKIQAEWFYKLSSEIEHNGQKFIPIIELAKISTGVKYTFSGSNLGTGNPLGSYYASYESSIKWADTPNHSAFVFSVDTLSFYRIEAGYHHKLHAKNQFQLFQKLEEWGFLDKMKEENQ